MKNKNQHIPARRPLQVSSWHRLQNGQWVVRKHGSGSNAQRGAITQPTLTVTFGFIVLISVTMLGFLYLNQVLGTASQGDAIQGLNEQLINLRERQQRLELEGAELRSMQSIEQRIQKLNFATTDHVTYLTATGKQLAAASPVQ